MCKPLSHGEEFGDVMSNLHLAYELAFQLANCAAIH